MIRIPRSRAYERSADHSRSNRTWSARAPPNAAQSAAQKASRATNASSSSSETGAAGIGEQFGRGGKRGCGGVRRAGLVGRPER